MEDFRPISVCNTSVKVISKVLANRLQNLLPQVISEAQSAFVRDRLISDNILIAHEIGHFIKTTKGNQEKVLSLKLDMSKAYDRLEWKFLRAVLNKFGFPRDWVELVMGIVTSVVYRVRVNDLFTNDIVPERGLRQGDPLSTYLFIICAEWLGRSLEGGRDSNRVHGIRIARDVPLVSHLFFADDRLVYLKADVDEARQLKEILNKYERLSGQKINIEKSEMVCSRNTEDGLKESIINLLGIKVVEKHSKYLGLPIVIGLNKREVFKFLKERMQRKILDWKYKLLSFAGKEKLVKSVLKAMPTYAMQCFRLSKKLCNTFFSMEASFLWGKGGNSKPIHWVSRKIVMKNKLEGGLGLKIFEWFNVAMLMKQVCRSINNPNLLVTRILKAKYFKSSHLLEACLGQRPSHAWRGILMAKSLLKESDFVMGTGVEHINRDGVVREVSCKALYNWMVEKGRKEEWEEGETSDTKKLEEFWRKLWKLVLPNKVKSFAWRLYRNSLPDSLNLRKRNCEMEEENMECGFDVETAIHIVMGCWKARAV
ncbi:hypothetical protein QQ045_011581 [Rhodiola kirilowii]